MSRWKYKSQKKALLGFLVNIALLIFFSSLLAIIVLFIVVPLVWIWPTGIQKAGEYVTVMTYLAIFLAPVICPALYWISFRTSPLQATPGSILFGERDDTEEIKSRPIILHFTGIFCIVLCVFVIPLRIVASIFFFGGFMALLHAHK